jgi:hypothetical protein
MGLSGAYCGMHDLAVIEKHKSFLGELRSAKYKLVMPDKPSEEMIYFLKHNVLFFDGY